MAPTTEIIIFDTSEEFRKDPKILIPAFDIALKSDGAQLRMLMNVHYDAISPAYYGLQIENDGATAYLFFNWDNYEAHKAFMDAPHYPTVIEKLKPCFKADGGESEMLHVEFSAPTIALDKPVTEVTIMTLKATENRAAVVEILSGLSEATKKSLVFGKLREDENKYVVIGGWQTVEEHAQMAAKPEAAAAIEKLSSLVKRDHLYHTKLLKYSP